MGKVYSKKDISDLHRARLQLYFEPLLQNMDLEESYAIPIIKDRLNSNSQSYKFNTSICFVSKSQCYKSFSIYGIHSYYNRKTKYKIADLSFIIGAWFNESELITRDELLSVDILILHSTGVSYNSDKKVNILIELINSRKTLNKVTWLFVDNCSKEEFAELYPGILDLFHKTYILNF